MSKKKAPWVLYLYKTPKELFSHIYIYRHIRPLGTIIKSKITRGGNMPWQVAGEQLKGGEEMDFQNPEALKHLL